MEAPVNETDIPFLKDKHIKFCQRCIAVLPGSCAGLDSTRMAIAFFAVSTFDLLDSMDCLKNEKKSIIEWIYNFQVETNEDFGFRGSSSSIGNNPVNCELYDRPHIAMTYTALAALLVLGDDLSRINKEKILCSLHSLQLSNGCFRPSNFECESDMRFVYCAAAICYILQDWSAVNVESMVNYIKCSINYDGGIGQGPGLESHGGSTYCAIATLALMGELPNALSGSQLKNLKRWLVMRQEKGFNGRPNKPDDTCYTFWVGASLKILNCYNFIDYVEVSKFVFSSQDEIVGGISKWADHGPDMLHTYLPLCGLLLHDSGSPFVFPALNVSQRAADWLNCLHKAWS